MGANLPALVVVLNVLLLIWTMMLVGGARRRYGIQAPTTTGHPDFERVFRTQANTIEATVQFLPSLWLAASYWNPRWAGFIGLAWIVGRAWYVIGYTAEARKRSMGFLIGFLATAALLIAGTWGVVRGMLGA
jgi:glutathione S-transferase